MAMELNCIGMILVLFLEHSNCSIQNNGWIGKQNPHICCLQEIHPLRSFEIHID